MKVKQLLELLESAPGFEDDLPIAWHIIKDALADGKVVKVKMYDQRGDKMGGTIEALFMRGRSPEMRFIEDGSPNDHETALQKDELEGAVITPLKGKVKGLLVSFPRPEGW